MNRLFNWLTGRATNGFTEGKVRTQVKFVRKGSNPSNPPPPPKPQRKSTIKSADVILNNDGTYYVTYLDEKIGVSVYVTTCDVHGGLMHEVIKSFPTYEQALNSANRLVGKHVADEKVVCTVLSD
ncbi:hypothetical protein Xoosp13_132 [Xanthomonas phage Xoo-sp13]|nr:hypothetical protein Xoosp13_132 [Xanthomonas phage Xoo-sp13]